MDANFLGRLIRSDHPERVNAVLAIAGGAAGILYLGYSMGRYGHTATWNTGFGIFMSGMVIPYMTAKLKGANNDPNKTEATGEQG